MLPIHVTVWDDGGSSADQVILVHGTLTWGQAAYAGQRGLGRERRILVVDRRGFGESPDTEMSDYDVDADDVIGLMDRPSHLVGHSYGGVVAMIAATRRPELVASLALIEPAALAVATSDPVVAKSLEGNRRYWPSTQSMTAEEYLKVVWGDQPVPEPYEWSLRAAGSALHERPCWNADVPLEPLRSATYPKLVLAGTWDTAAPDYRAAAGEALIATSRFIATQTGATFIQVEGADHSPHQQRPDEVNELLLDLWRQADPPSGGGTTQRGALRSDDGAE
jgi:pimeloyl-ACP methyl ester carboxylesterase